MRPLMLLLGLVLAAAVQAGGGSVARADDGTTFGATIWAPYVSVDDTTIEIFNNGDAPTWPRIDITLRTTSAGPSCSVGLCRYAVQAPEIDPGESWTLRLADRACSTGLNEHVCLPDGAIGGAQIDAAIMTGTGANAGATSPDPDGNIAAVVTTEAGAYDAVVSSDEATLTDVARNLAARDGASTAIRVIGALTVIVDWYRHDGTLVAEQRVGTGSYCCGEKGYFHTAAVSVDARDVDGLDDDATYTVVVTSVDGATFAAVTTDAP